MTEFKTQQVNFQVDADTVRGVLRIPEGDGPWPALVFAGPLTSVKEQVVGHYAEAMARRGFVTLAIDNRHFGESDGSPRYYEHPGKKCEDTIKSLDFLAARDEVDADRLGAVGVCAGAGYIAKAVADDSRLKAFGTVAGFFHDLEQQKQWMGDGFDAALTRAKKARETYESTGESEEILAVGNGDEEVAMPLAEAYEYYGTPRGAVDNYHNAFAVMSREHTLTWNSMAAAPNIKAATLMIHSDNALAPALAKKFFEKLAGPKEKLWVESVGQIDFYDRPERIEPAADELAKHFSTHL